MDGCSNLLDRTSQAQTEGKKISSSINVFAHHPSLSSSRLVANVLQNGNHRALWLYCAHKKGGVGAVRSHGWVGGASLEMMAVPPLGDFRGKEKKGSRETGCRGEREEEWGIGAPT